MRLVLVLFFSTFSLLTNAQRVKDSANISSTIKAFYSWYNGNWEKLTEFKLYEGTESPDSPPYRINWKEVDRYTNWMQKNALQLDEEFYKNERMHFQYADSAFKANPEEEIPMGFDYDRFTDSQESPEWMLEEIEKATKWKFSINGNDAKVEILSAPVMMEDGGEVEYIVGCIELKKRKGLWKIAKIGCTFADEPGEDD